MEMVGYFTIKLKAERCAVVPEKVAGYVVRKCEGRLRATLGALLCWYDSIAGIAVTV